MIDEEKAIERIAAQLLDLKLDVAALDYRFQDLRQAVRFLAAARRRDKGASR